MSGTITVRELHTMPELTTCVQLQYDIWGITPGNNTSSYIMNAAIHNGGAVHGAYSDDTLVGFCFGFAAKRPEGWLLWSHMAGVLPGYQGQGIGRKLKFVQRTWAAENGYSAIGWTFDPMQAGNARFNLRHLNTVAFYFHPNHYGEMNDALNRGLASDRLEATWYTADDDLPDLRDDNEEKTALVTAAEVSSLPQSWDAPAYTIEIPQNLNDLKRRDLQAATDWQTAVREALTAAFANGYAAVDFQTQDARCYYVLRRHRPHL